MRRATGKPGKIIRPPSQSIYEETEFTPSIPVKRSVSNLSTVRGPAPTQPPPRLGGSPMTVKKRLSTSMSSGGSSEQLDSLHEKRASLVSSGEDVGGTDYEPIQDYLLSGANESLETSRMSVNLEAPSYPAPPPPKGSPHTTEDDDDGYTKVSLMSGSVVESDFKHSAEWAELPLKVKSGHTPIPRQSPEWATPTNSRLSTSPQDLSPPKTTDIRGKIKIPPEPTTPPPSPPMALRDGPSPQPRAPSPLTQAQTSPEQPQLPLKQKQKKQQRTVVQDNNVYEFDRLVVSPSNEQQPADDGVYFDHLSGPPEMTGPTVKATPTEPPQDGSVYFDHLAEPPPSTSNSRVMSTTNQNTPSNQVTQSSNQNPDDVYFDHLVSGSPPVKPEQQVDSLRSTGELQ